MLSQDTDVQVASLGFPSGGATEDGEYPHVMSQAECIELARLSSTVNDFGKALSIFFRDPDGLEGEVLLAKP